MTLLLFFCGFPCTVAQITASCITKCGQKCKELRGERRDEKKRKTKQTQKQAEVRFGYNICVYIYIHIYIMNTFFHFHLQHPETVYSTAHYLCSHIHVNLKSFHFRNIKFWWRNTKKISGQAFLSVSVLSTKLTHRPGDLMYRLKVGLCYSHTGENSSCVY